VFSLVLGLAYEGLHIYVNDYDAFLRSYASEKINFCRSKKPSNQYFFVRGKKKSARLEAEKLDRVIVRNSLHHFSHQAEMLASIRESLAPGGSLYIYDPVLRPDNKANCPLIMEAEALRQAITGNGFDIVEEKENTRSKWLMLHCKPRVSN
jgi:SAM-dependent methyltransferase